MLLSCIPFNGKEVFKILLEKVQSSATQWTSKAKYIYIYIYIYLWRWTLFGHTQEITCTELEILV